MKRWLLILMLSGSGFAQLWSGVLDPARATDWTVAGIPGFTPTSLPSDSWTQSGATIAPCGTSGSPVTPTACGIVAALNAANGTNQYVKLGAGTFHLSTGADLAGYSKTELRGSGPGQTIITMHGTAGCQGGGGNCDFGFRSNDNTDPPTVSVLCTITGGLTQGSTSITVGSGCNQAITANLTLLTIDACNTGFSGATCGTGSAVDNGNWFVCADQITVTPTGCSGNGPSTGLMRTERDQREVVLVTACSPSCGTAGAATLTLDRKIIHANWASLSNPGAYIIQPAQLVGFRDFTIDDSSLVAGNCSSGGASLSFKNVLNGWSKNVVYKNSCNDALWVDFGLGGDYESNYSYNAGQNLTTSADPTGFQFMGAGFYVANNIITGVRECIFTTAPTVGSVFAYNLCLNPYEGNGFQYPGLADGHSGGDDYGLWEGNMTVAILNDLIHGTHDGNTYLHNHATGWKYCGNSNGGTPLCGADAAANSAVSAWGILAYHRYDNLISNISGTSGVHTTYQDSAGTNEFGNNIIYMMGTGNGAFPTPVLGDSNVISTTMRWGNYDTVNNAVLFCTAAATPIAACTANERANGASTFPGLASPSTTIPASFVYSSRPPWYSSSIPFPAIGDAVTGGNVGNCNGVKNTAGQYGGLPATSASQCAGQSLNTTGAAAWGGHVNAIPALVCFFSLGGVPDGSNAFLSGFDATTCYASAPTPPTAGGALGNGAKISNGAKAQ